MTAVTAEHTAEAAAGTEAPEPPAETQQTASWEEVTPETAAEWLKLRHPKQRPLVPGTVAMYAREMTAEPPRFNPDSPQGLVFDEDNYLTDGQHRLEAVVKAGKTYRLWVTRGASRDTMKVFDVGAKRTTAQRLHIDGVRDPNVQAAIARFLILWDLRQFWARRYKISHEELAIRITTDPMIAQATAWAAGWTATHQLTRSQAGFLWYIFTRASDPENEGFGTAEEFLNAVRDGIGLEGGDPRYVLRERLSRSQLAWRIADKQRAREIRIILSVYAWNRWRAGKTITRLQLPDVVSDATMVRPV
jgi:hypothetical protein